MLTDAIGDMETTFGDEVRRKVGARNSFKNYVFIIIRNKKICIFLFHKVTKLAIQETPEAALHDVF